jgi:hypothetical protein
MRGRGINYDTGFVGGSRPEFAPEVVARELQIIAEDLHCTAVRVSGEHPERLSVAGELALDQGLEVWYAPFSHDMTTPELLSYFVECAHRAEALRRESPDIVLVLGCELTLFQHGFMPGGTFMERILNALGQFPASSERAFALPDSEELTYRLNSLLADAVAAARAAFDGRITYASGKWEQVDWSVFDIVSVDLYRQRANADVYLDQLRSYLAFGKPVAITEFGCCTFHGAAEFGGVGWTIMDGGADPPRLRGDHVRDEAEQAALLRELLGLFIGEGVDSAFWFTFVQPGLPHCDDPLFDLDLASYAVVKTLERGRGITYPDVSWEPKESFYALAEIYASLREAA